MSKTKLSRIAGILMILTVISKFIGLGRDSLVASAFGATYQTDAYLLALTIPYMVFDLFGSAITTSFMPILSESYSKKGKSDMFALANSIMNILIIVTSIALIIVWLFTPQIVRLLAPTFNDTAYSLSVKLTKLSVLNILFLSLNSGFTAILQALDEFTAASIVGIVMNIPIILYILIFDSINIVGLTVATIVGNGIQLLVYIPWLIKNKYKYRTYIQFKDTRIKKMLLLVSPILIGIGVDKINSIVTKSMASTLIEGSIATLDIANKLNSMLYLTFAAAIVTVIYPSLAREGSSKELTKFKQYLSKAIISVNLLMIPSAFAMVILRVPIISVLFKHGSFDDRAVEMTAVAILYLSAGMIFFAIRDVCNRAFYSLQDTKTPMINGVLGVSVNIVLNIVLGKLMGLGGLALATSITAFVISALLVINLRKKLGNIGFKKILVSSMKILVSSIVMGIGILLLRNALQISTAAYNSNLLIILLCSALGCIIYSLMLIILKEEEFFSAFYSIKSRFNYKNKKAD